MFGLSTANHGAFACGVLGNLLSFFVYLAPLPTFWRICKRGKTEGFQSIPYVVAFFSAMLWIYYALLKGNSGFLITINSVGCFIEIVYILIYFVFAPKKSKIITAISFMLLNVGVFGLIAVVIELVIKKHIVRVKTLGWMNTVISICVFVAPLTIIRRVIRTRSVEYMPFTLSMFLTLSAVAWFFYGFLLHDNFVAIPNVLGFLFGLVQMILYAVYKNKKKADEDNNVVNAINVDANDVHEVVITVLGPTHTAEVHPVESEGCCFAESDLPDNNNSRDGKEDGGGFVG